MRLGLGSSFGMSPDLRTAEPIFAFAALAAFLTDRKDRFMYATHEPVISARGVAARYAATTVVNGADLDVSAGECVALLGASGSGKSTLLSALAGVHPLTTGRVVIDGVDLSTLSPSETSALRLRRIGFVFQFPALLPELTLAENVALPLRVIGTAKGSAGAAALQQLHRFGVAHLANRRPHEVSGGELQRAAVGRALVHHPRVLLADEPTGALDSTTRTGVLRALVDAAREDHAACLIVTHDSQVASEADRMLTMSDGRLAAEHPVASPGVGARSEQR